MARPPGGHVGKTATKPLACQMLLEARSSGSTYGSFMVTVMPISFGIDVPARSYPERTMNRTCTKSVLPSLDGAMTWNERK
jgi:hypothetical protein